MMNTRNTVALCHVPAFLLLLTISSSSGQEKPAPPVREASVPVDTFAAGGQKLPQIDLPEFQITGNERIDLPQFRKELAQDENIFDAGSWKPGPGRREAAQLDLGGGVKQQMNGAPAGVNGKAILGYGSYQTPSLDGWFGKNFGTYDFLIQSGYTSSGGFFPNSDYRRAHSSLSGGTYVSDDAGILSGARINGMVGFRGDGYGLYGSDMPHRDRTVNRFLSSVSLSSSRYAPLFYTSAAHVQTTSVSDSNRASETLVGLDVSANREIDGYDLKGDFGLWTGFLAAPSRRHNPYHSLLGFTARRGLGDRFDITAGAGLYIFRGSDTRTLVRLYPRLGAAWYASDMMMYFIRYEPFVQRNELSRMVKANPYMATDIRIRHQEVFHSIALGVEAELTREIKGKISLNHRIVRNQPVFVDGASRGIWSALYAGVTRTVALEAGVYADVTPVDHFAGSFELRASRNTVTGKRSPYDPSAFLSGLYRHTFPFGLSLGTTIQLTGQQYTDPENTSSIAGFVLFDFVAEYTVGHGFGVNGTINNVLNTPHRWWQGYQSTPRAASLALTYSW